MVSPSARQDSRAGFTLVELAITIAIIGVLAGAITTGQYLIRQSQVQALAADLTQFTGAYKQFQTQYNGMAGDIVDATDFWGADPNGCPTNNVQTPRHETCNGNGNREVAETNTYAIANESFRFWQQLADAGYIKGTYTGVSTSATNGWAGVGGLNLPAGKVSRSFYATQWLPVESGNGGVYDGNYGNTIQYGMSNAAGAGSALLSVRDMAALDAKLDDGSPGTGTFLSFKPAVTPNCVTGTTPSTAAYNFTGATTSLACNFIYVLGN